MTLKEWLSTAPEAEVVAWLVPIFLARGDDHVTGWPHLIDALEAELEQIILPTT